MKVLDEFIYEKNMMYKYLSVDVEYYQGEKESGITEITAMPYCRLKEYIDKELYRKKKGQSIHMPILYSSEPYDVIFIHPDAIDDESFLIDHVPRYEAFLILEIGHESDDMFGYYAKVKSMYDDTEYILQSQDIDGNLSYSRVA